MASHQNDLSSVIRRERSGWYLPADDGYFAQFVAGPPPKRNGFYRDHLLAALKYVRRWEVAVDVGAHCGFWTWDLAQQFCTVYAFEPALVTFECLLKNTEECENVNRMNVAIGERAGRCNIQNDRARPGNSGSNYIVPTEEGTILMLSLDSLDLPACDFLKIDVEGYELHALQGARKLIKRFRPVISMECTDRKFRGRYDIDEGAAEHWLVKRGYRVAWAERPDKAFVPA